MQFRDKKVLVVGAGKSGLAVSRFLTDKKAEVTLTDAAKPAYLGRELERLASEGVDLFLGGYPAVNRAGFELVVMSPGVPLTTEPAREAAESGIPVIGELELAYHFTKAPVVAITGTNGKTTTTALLGEIFKDGGFKTLVGGNIGLPLVTEVENYGPGDIIVAEVSSFQLETTVAFKPKVAVILNLTPDHLDRHGTMENYASAKARIFANQGKDDFTVLNYDDPLTAALGSESRAGTVYFSRCRILEAGGVYVRDNMIMANINGSNEAICSCNELGIPGAHNLENALAAVAAAKAAGVGNAALARTLKKFKGVPHRLEFIAEINGVKYINDSKGTNPDAAIKALEAFTEPVVLIAGGKSKGSDFSDFAAKVRERARVLIVLGECAGIIADSFKSGGVEQLLFAGDFDEAVYLAHRNARPGEIVLLSPACASWDMFPSYEERGNLFKELVLKIKKNA